MNAVLLLFIIIIVALVCSRLSKIRRAVKNPRLDILDLSAGDAVALVAADKAALREVFPSPQESNRDVPQCDVLFLYAGFSRKGRVEGYARGLREIIRDSGAKVVVIASENSQDGCTKAGARKPYGRANLVITLARRGEAFPRFFRELFSKMKNGVSMPAAWVQLAPQVPNNEHIDCPSTIFLCELGQIRFK